MLFCLVATFFVFSFLSFVNAQNTLCSGTIGKYKYNIEKLKEDTGGNDVTVKDENGNTYYYRPCQALQQANCQTITDPVPAACQKDTRITPQYHDCGSTTQYAWRARAAGDNTGFYITFNGGEEDRRLDVEFECDKTAGVGSLKAAIPTESPTHFYHLNWKSAYACPSGGGGGGGGSGDDGMGISPGWIFIIILLGIGVMYLILGVAFKKFLRDAHGWELIPNNEFWFALPGLVIDGNKYLWRKATGLCGVKYQEM